MWRTAFTSTGPTVNGTDGGDSVSSQLKSDSPEVQKLAAFAKIAAGEPEATELSGQAQLMQAQPQVAAHPAARAAQREAAHNLEIIKRMRETEEAILARAPEHDLQPSLDPIRAVMELLDDPQRSYPVIHLTGTNGKTSTTRIIESLLREVGVKTGRFTSPHLHSMTERIALSGEPISPEKFLAAYDEVLPFIEMVDASSVAAGGPRMTYFEVLVAVAYAAFADAPVDVAIVEVGLGGSWDATNAADAVRISGVPGSVSGLALADLGLASVGALVAYGRRRGGACGSRASPAPSAAARSCWPSGLRR